MKLLILTILPILFAVSAFAQGQAPTRRSLILSTPNPRQARPRRGPPQPSHGLYAMGGPATSRPRPWFLKMVDIAYIRDDWRSSTR